VDCWYYQTGTDAEMYTACTARTTHAVAGGSTWDDLYKWADNNNYTSSGSLPTSLEWRYLTIRPKPASNAVYVECFWFKEETFANCETRTYFDEVLNTDWEAFIPNATRQHWFYDKENSQKVDCWRFAYENYANCITRSSNRLMTTTTKFTSSDANPYIYMYF